MVHKRCFLCNFASPSDKENGGFHVFCVPKDKVEVWQEILLHKPGLTQNSRLCHRHFSEEDIIKGYLILDQFHPLKQWRLKKDVVPTLHLGLKNTFLYLWH